MNTSLPTRLPPRRALHQTAAALLALALCTGLVGASCTGILDLEGYREAAPALCDVLAACYGRTGIPGCLGHVESRLEGAGEPARKEWLRRFLADNCLQSCVDAWLCLDIPPVCEPPGKTCSFPEQCCGFTTGLGECSLQRCCIPNGVACASSEDCCAGQCTNGVCGGIPCKLQDEPCVNSFECCSNICDPKSNTCAENTCREDGFECQSATECCSSFCNSSNVCGIPPCIQDGNPCVDSTQCCFGLECDPLGSCTPPGGCNTDNDPCTTDSDCCSMYCDTLFGLCGAQNVCRQLGEACTMPGECCSGICGSNQTCGCLLDGDPCAPGFDYCCNGYCNGLTCGKGMCQDVGAICMAEAECCSGLCPAGICCAPGTCGDPCVEASGPLDPMICAGTGMDSPCIPSVCITQPKCCCEKWDATCVMLAQTLCIGVCPGPPPPP